MNQPVLTLTLCALFGGLLPRLAVSEEPAPVRTFRKGVVIHLEGIILPQLEGFINRKLDRAQGLGADLVILEIASPGGALEVTLELADRLRDLQWAAHGRLHSPGSVERGGDPGPGLRRDRDGAAGPDGRRRAGVSGSRRTLPPRAGEDSQ